MTDPQKLAGEYKVLDAKTRANLACEMAQEIMEHYDGARALVTALLNELGNLGHEAMQAKRLAEVLNMWITSAENSNQEGRLLVCLEASISAAG